MIDAIGGYPELELRKGEHYHKNAIRLNTARNCFEYVLRARGYDKVYIPYYTCEVMLEPLEKCNVKYEFYHINQKLEPAETIQLQPSEAFLYTNYYGLKQQCVERLAQIYGNQLIVDNAQAFFAAPLDGIDTFYSARKFFGVADGAYLYTDKLLNIELEQDQSYERMAHLLIRADVSAEAGYADFRKNDDALCGEPIKRMSRLTEKILCSIDYEACKVARRRNYLEYESALKERNKLSIHLDENAVPLAYPLQQGSTDLRKLLINNRIFVPCYWPNVTNRTDFQLEADISNSLLPLTCDQRYEKDHIQRILKTINI